MYYEQTAPQFIKMLKNLNVMLGKAAEFADGKKIEVDVLLQSRLAPDQFNFIRQIQIACDSAKLCCARLTGKDAPVNDDAEKSLNDLRARIDQTVSFMHTLSAKDFENAASKKITQPRWEGKWLTAEDYLTQHAIPNVYFHVTTAYAILRHNGVGLGKKDYLGEMPYKH
jgi:hypothetical protein